MRDRRALQSVALQFLINGLVWASFAPRVTELRDNIGADVQQMGFVLAAAAVGGLAGSAMCDRLISTFGTRRVVIVGGVGLIVPLPLIGLATSPVALATALAVLGFADVVSDVAMNIQGSRLSARRRVPVMNRLHGLWSLGTVIGGLFSVWLARSGVSIRTQLLIAPFLFAALLTAVGPGLLNVDEPPQAGPERAHKTTSARRVVLLIGLMGVLATTMEMVPSDWAPFRLRDDLASGPSVAAWGFVSFTTGMFIGRFFGDFVQARIGDRTMQGLSPILSAVGVGVASVVDSAPVVLLGFVVAGLGASVLFPFIYDLGAKAAAGGKALGAMTAGSLSGVAGATGHRRDDCRVCHLWGGLGHSGGCSARGDSGDDLEQSDQLAQEPVHYVCRHLSNGGVISQAEYPVG